MARRQVNGIFLLDKPLEVSSNGILQRDSLVISRLKKRDIPALWIRWRQACCRFVLVRRLNFVSFC